jgi:hypothetical protein
MVATRLTGRDEPTRSGRSEPAAAGHPPITALLGSVRGTSGGRDGEGGAVKRATATSMNGVNGSTHRWPRAQAMITAQQQRTAAHMRYPPWSAGKEGLRALPRGQIPPVASRLGAAGAASTQSFNLSSTMTVQCSPLGCARRPKWEDGLQTVLGISETALGEVPDRKPTGSIGSRLHQIANNVPAAWKSIVATLREVLDDRFWEESP